MATAPSTPADEHGRSHARLAFVLRLIGPAVLLTCGALVIGSLFLPWHHSDARYLVGDPYPSDFQPFVPMQPFGAGDLYWLTLAAIPIMVALVCLLIDATPRLREQELTREFVNFVGIFTLVTGGVGIISLIFSNSFMYLAGTVPHLLDVGYFVSLASYILLVPGAILLMIGQAHVRKMVRVGRLRAP